MAWKIKFLKKAEKELNNIPAKYQKRILTILPIIADSPFAGKKLKGECDGCYSYRIWPYRVIYKVYKKESLILILRIGHRQGVY